METEIAENTAVNAVPEGTDSISAGSGTGAAAPGAKEAPAVTEKEPDENEVAAAINRELSMINALDPTVKSFDDILDSEAGELFTEKVKRGYSLYDAFLVSNRDRILKAVTEAAHQSALNSVNSKSHLTGTGVSKAEGLTEVPSKTYALYRAMFPELSDQQIRAHYAKHNRRAR